jgi:CO/xanthine dehydrogenase Mo-binding subunit
MLKNSLPGSLAVHPRLNSWIAVDQHGIITLFPGKVELGQGLLTALAQIAADELDVPLSYIKLKPATTGVSPNEGVTSGSLSIRDCGMAIRQVAAEVRRLFLEEAARRLSVPVDSLAVNDGVIRGAGNRTLSYGVLAASVSLAREASGVALPKSPDQRHSVGQSFPRIDIPGRVFGTRGYLNDIPSKQMLNGCVLQPPRPGAKLIGLDEAALKRKYPDVTLVRDGSFVAVIASTEVAARKAIKLTERLAQWTGGFELPDASNLGAWLEGQALETEIVEQKGEASISQSATRLTRGYTKPFLAHGAIGPSCAIAEWHEGKLFVITHSQGVYNLRADLALVFDMPVAQIEVTHAEGSGCYGHNGADDVALDAALLARAVPGHTVRVQRSRSDELSASPFGAAMHISITADLADDGSISDWTHQIWSNGHTARPGRAKTPALQAAFALEKPFSRLAASDPPLATGGGAQRNAVPYYDIPNRRIIKHRVVNEPLRTSSMRSLGAIGNVFAIESFMDELAEKAGNDPLDFRLKQLSDPRARAVLERVAEMASWGKTHLKDGVGQGLAFARYKNTSGYCAVIAEIDVNAEPKATHLWIAADIGEVINPDGAINQIEGGAIQATSWALKEEVRFSRDSLACETWEQYPILRFSEVPKVEVSLLQHPHEPPLGAGEIAHGPTAAALANAIHNALSVRVREMPLTKDRILAAMESH